MSEADNTQRLPRIESLNLVSVQHFNQDNTADLQTVGRTLDLSDGGIKLEVATAPPLYSRLSLMIALKDTLINVQGEVVYLSVINKDQIHMGLKFLNLSEEDKQHIQNYLSLENKNT